MFGLLNIDKPGGMTSRDVVNRVAQLVRPDKVGHAGTLDPLATGVLVLCIGKATRLVPYIQEQRKSYRAGFRFGCTSDTDDVEGDVRELPDAPKVTLSALEAALPSFVGQIEQVPPRFSAVKIKGRRAYDLARRGNQPQLEARSVQIHSIRIADFSCPDLTLDIECGSGTYVRAIGRDLGRALGSGAIMTELCRTGVGVFRQETALCCDDLDREAIEGELLPASMALPERPSCTVSDAEVRILKQGRGIRLRHGATAAPGPGPVRRREHHLEAAPLMALVDASGRLIAVAETWPDRLVPRQVFV